MCVGYFVFIVSFVARAHVVSSPYSFTRCKCSFGKPTLLPRSVVQFGERVKLLYAPHITVTKYDATHSPIDTVMSLYYTLT